MEIFIPERLRTERAPKGIPTPWLKRGVPKRMVSDDWWVRIDGRWFCVPAGYIFDGSSIPRPLWWLFPPSYSPAWEASAFHDLCYSHLYQQVSKRFADDAFKAIMLYEGTDPLIAWGFHKAVTWFGKGGW